MRFDELRFDLDSVLSEISRLLNDLLCFVVLISSTLL